jgi:hypothetical protein
MVKHRILFIHETISFDDINSTEIMKIVTIDDKHAIIITKSNIIPDWAV